MNRKERQRISREWEEWLANKTPTPDPYLTTPIDEIPPTLQTKTHDAIAETLPEEVIPF